MSRRGRFVLDELDCRYPSSLINSYVSRGFVMLTELVGLEC